MPINNLNNNHLTEVQKTEIETALSALETVLSSLNVALTPKERSIYGSVKEKNKLLINKVWDYRRSEEWLSKPDLDWEEFENDLKSRQFLEAAIFRLHGINISLKNSKILHDYDNYRSALDDYRYTRYKAESNVAGFEIKRAELKQFFPHLSKKVESNKEIPDEI